ncbi:MAG: iron-containing alcohol dehydrogenase, partial [Lentisphaerae bacterium]|nr:iron-containing alcohol dehydrogenase [Lentisphaerota bacterium]
MWKYKMPVEVDFGYGSRQHITNLPELAGRRLLVATDERLAETPMIAELIESLSAVEVFTDIEPNPTVESVDALADRLRSTKAEALVAIGGGSVLDCAKAAAVLALDSADSIRHFHSGGAALPSTRLPLVVIPTTAGTGSEVTPFAVLDDRAQGIKAPLGGNALYPSVALIDPQLTESLPLSVTAASGLDALSHCMEGYWSINHQPLCDLMAIEGARIVFENLERAMLEPSDSEARSKMSYAALLGGMAFQLPKNAMVHACSFPLSQQAHLSHGAACAFTLEFALRLNAPATGGRMERFAAGCGFETIDDMAAAIRHLKQVGGLPITLRDVGIKEDEVDALIAG